MDGSTRPGRSRPRRVKPRTTCALAVFGGAYGVAHVLGRTWSSTPAERRSARPGDELVVHPTLVTNHAITIDAPAECVWPWLVQMGWHRGGWYTARWVDRLLFPANHASADRIVAELQHLGLGDSVPDGPPETQCGFVVARMERDRTLVLHSREHLPLSWRARFAASMNWSWTFSLDALDGGRTRLLIRSRAALAPRWIAALYWMALPTDFVMARQMLQGIRRRAELTVVAPDLLGAT